MDGMAVRLHDVGKRYAHFALKGVDLEVARGRALGVVGQNGAGKSTLLRIVMGLVRADGGTVEVLGRAMPAEERAIKREVGFVSEDMALYRGATLRWHMDLVRLDVLRELAAARRDGRTVIFSSHRGDDVAGLADDVAFIHAGRVVGRGPAAAFAGSGRSIEEAFVEQVRGSAVGRAA
jgi:ABC-type multidrug transport system ATPase subunit